METTEPSLVVGPSNRLEQWRRFLIAPRWSTDELQYLIEADDVGAAFFTIETYINGLYRGLQKSAHLRAMLGQEPPSADDIAEAHAKARWLSSNSEPFRRALGWRQRELDLGLLGWMRRASCLSLVLGAGASMGAGGPSWITLVQRLLLLALERGAEVFEMRPDPDNTPEHRSFKRVVTGVRRLEPEAEQIARRILAQIAQGTADTEALMNGAQVCYDLLGQHLFTDLTQLIYRSAPGPGEVHRAIAELARPQWVRDRGASFPGWDSIITYNFDDLMGEALDLAGIARAAFTMRGDKLVGDPNGPARAEPSEPYQGIYHLHGYTPRRLFRITDVKFVFSTAQYQAMYADKQGDILRLVFENWLAHPVHHALYVGCSFLDEAMNQLLRDAADALPGRYHYALLRWPGANALREASVDEVDAASLAYQQMGVRPLFFEDFAEIPALIRSLS